MMSKSLFRAAALAALLPAAAAALPPAETPQLRAAPEFRREVDTWKGIITAQLAQGRGMSLPLNSRTDARSCVAASDPLGDPLANARLFYVAYRRSYEARLEDARRDAAVIARLRDISARVGIPPESTALAEATETATRSMHFADSSAAASRAAREVYVALGGSESAPLPTEAELLADPAYRRQYCGPE
jgi:hypothetical protein